MCDRKIHIIYTEKCNHLYGIYLYYSYATLYPKFIDQSKMRFFEILIENHSKYLVGGTNFYDRLSQFSYQTNSFLL